MKNVRAVEEVVSDHDGSYVLAALGTRPIGVVLRNKIDKPLRVALLTNFIAPYMIASGIGELYRTLAEGLGRAGHRVTVIGVGIHDATTSQHAWGELVSLKPAKRNRFIPRSMQDAYLVAREVYRQRKAFDVVEGTTYPGLLAFVANKKLPSIARVITSVAVDSDGWRPRTVIHFLLEWLSVRRATVVFCSTDYIQRKAQQVYGFRFARTTRVLLGIQDLPMTNEELNLSRPLRFLVIAGATSRKGTDVLIRALAIVTRQTAEFEVEIIGPGYARYDEYIARSPILTDEWTEVVTKLAGRLHVRYDVDDSEKFRLLSKSDYVIVASRSESFGIPVIEAMRFGVPVIASRGGALSEVAGASVENRLYDDPEDFFALSKILLESIALGPADAKRRAAAARAAYEANFTADFFVEKSISGYREAIKSRG